MPVSDLITESAAEYKAVLSSTQFSGNTNSSRFLKFVVDKHFAGIHHISEYEIAVEGLGRRADFDPAQDSIVRVEAHRVRKRLRDHYEREGLKNKLRLVLPYGSYIPQFVWFSETEVAEPVQLESEPPPHFSKRPWYAGKYAWLLLAGSCGIALAGVLAIYLRQHVRTLETRPAAEVLTHATAPVPEDVMIMAGSSAINYADRLGHAWTGDRFFNGGQPWTVRYRRILRTDDSQIFLTARQGGEFGYDIPLHPGLYELRLYFAETFYGDDNSEGGGESSRIFDVTANGTPLLTNFDPLADAGGSNTADMRVFTGISPAADGKLHLKFSNPWQIKGVAFVNAIHLTPTAGKQMLPVRWVTSSSAVVDHESRLWLPDQFVQGGRRRELSEVVGGTNDAELYKSERYGNFSYAITVADNATYSLTLYFSEHWFGVPNFGGADDGSSIGKRLFDVYCNGVTLLQNFDIYKESGGSLKTVSRTFHGLRPNHQGKLLLTFAPNKDYPSLSALEVIPEPKK